MDNMFSSDNIYLRCYFFVIFFATTYAAPGGLGSFAGSNSAAFSSASANAYAGSVASAISSANAFTGGTFPSKNPDGTYGLTHQQGISAGSGSYVGLGSINPDSNKFGSPHQAFGTKGSYNDNKSQTVCSGCPNVKEKWELDNYDDQSEEEPQEEEEEDDCDDGQYRPEHHYHHHKSKVDKKQEQQTVSSVHKIGNNDQYNYNQTNDKDGYSDNKGPENIHDGRYNNYGNSGHVGANNQNLNNNYNAYQHDTGALKDSLHPSSSWTDINKKKENENKNSGNSGVVTPTSTIGKNYGNTNIGASGGITPSQINLGLTRDTNADCSNTKSGSRANCVESIADSNSNQAPVKLSQSNIKKTINAISSEGNRATTECNNLHGNCDSSKTGETAQYQSTSVDSTNNLQNGYTDSTEKKNKPHSYDQEKTGQWRDQPNKGNLPSGPSPACSNEASTLQKNTPIPTQTYGTVGSGPSNVGVGNKPHSYDQQNTGEWRDQPNKGNLPSGPAGNVGAGSGCKPGGSSICTSEIPSVQKNIPTSSYTFGTVATGPYQNNKDTKQSGNCGAFSSSTCVGSTGVPIGNSQKIDGDIGSGHNVHGQTNSGNKNSYKLNAGNPFLHGGQDNPKPFIHTTSSPIFITNNVDSIGTTSKPIGFGNPFLDGTISNTFGTEHDKHNIGMNPIKSDPFNKPIGTGNPFLTNSGNGGSKSSTPIYSGASIGSISSPSIQQVSTTVLPIGQNNPFLEVSGGNVVNKYPPGVYPSVTENNKNVFSGSGTSANKEFPKSGVGITSSGSNPNTNRGVKGGNQHNKIFENVATSNAGALSTGNVDTDKSTGLNIPNAYNNNNNVGHGASSLPGTANINKPSYTLSTSPESYGHKDMLPRTSGSDGATNGNGNSPSNSLINGHNTNGQFNPQITNAGAQSFAGAHAGSFASSFSSSQASSSSSSFASSKSGSYTANGDPNILHQLNRNWPFDIATSVSGASSWPSLNAGSHASAFASSSAGSWSGSEPIGVKS
ncbi:putative uncharacterized protein DDB_G0282133 [Vespula pensylvanica]|uniref:putative uncharacterized protein DDB_G0282133 n=1 Tax=Vespula pensylvanica TaxID=30213 RepID=UPI001CBA5A95|nr:putative uncharacterized protein DDB_G0282133 [Vespula pensylvanica]